ncbi:MAG: FAD-dependent oxidoreductase [Desulfobacteraceae bacterium]|nr:FAD-dependent oxidoreductase [Desulfobacteraceae bacterium]
MEHFVIIGGDAAGMSAASRVRRHHPDLDVTVLEQSRDVSYSACGMPYNIADPERYIEDLVVRKAEVFREKQGINLLTGHQANSIDRQNRVVEADGPGGKALEFSYDKLLIATGALPVMPDIDGIDLPGVMPLKRLADGRNIKAYLAQNHVQDAVIIGMGYIGMEMCEAFAQLGINVKMASRGFLSGYNGEIAAKVYQYLQEQGIELHESCPVSSIERHNGRLRANCGKLAIDGDVVLVGIGVVPNSAMAAEAGIELGVKGAISVDRYMRTSDPDVFSAGDCADAYHVVTGEKVWIPLALRANRGGWAVADNLKKNITSLDGVAGTSVFKIFDLEVARTGLNAEQAKNAGFSPAEVVIESRTRAHSHPGGAPIWVNAVGDKVTGRLLGMQIVSSEGAAHRINAAAVALHSGMNVESFAQCDLAYAPPFSPVWDPMLTAANQLIKKIQERTDHRGI